MPCTCLSGMRIFRLQGMSQKHTREVGSAIAFPYDTGIPQLLLQCDIFDEGTTIRKSPKGVCVYSNDWSGRLGRRPSNIAAV